MDYREIEPYKDKNNSPIQEEDFIRKWKSLSGS